MKPEDKALFGGAAGGGKNVAFYEFIKTALDSEPLGMDLVDRMKAKHISLVKRDAIKTRQKSENRE